MNLNRYISRLLAKSLLVTFGTLCFSCRIYSTEKNCLSLSQKDYENLIKAFEMVEKKTNKKKKQSNESFLSKKRENKSDSVTFDSSKQSMSNDHNDLKDDRQFFDDTINKALGNTIRIGYKNVYVEESKTENKKIFAKACTKCSMLQIARIILELRDLEKRGNLKNFAFATTFLNEIEEIEKNITIIQMRTRELNDDQLITFIKIFLPILNAIAPVNYKQQLSIKHIKKSLRIQDDLIDLINYKDHIVHKALFDMFDTLNLFTQCNISKPELLAKDLRLKIANLE